MPERLRLNNYRPTPVKAVDVKPPSPSVDTQLAPLKVSKAKQSPVPLNVKTQHTSPTSSSPRETGTPESNEAGKQWARKSKVKTDPLALSPVGFVFTRVIAINVVNREWLYKRFFNGWHGITYASKAKIIQLFTEISNMLRGFQSIAKLLCWLQFYPEIKNWFSNLSLLTIQRKHDVS